jgi:hypothetical protein
MIIMHLCLMLDINNGQGNICSFKFEAYSFLVK